MSRFPYRAIMRPHRVQRTAPVTHAPAPVAEPAVEPEVVPPAPVAEAPDGAGAVAEAPDGAGAVAEAPDGAGAVAEAPAPVAEPAPRVNSASNKTDLLAAAAALGLTEVSATNTRAEIWAAIQAAQA
jgi:hypothetical protein